MIIVLLSSNWVTLYWSTRLSRNGRNGYLLRCFLKGVNGEDFAGLRTGDGQKVSLE